MKRTKNAFFYISRSFILIFLTLLIISVAFYLLCPVYNFEDSQPFKGNSIFNPYAELENSYWQKASLHTHTKASDGKNTIEEVMEAYHRIGYNIVAITDHSRVISSGAPAEKEIPAYEHGINLSFFHSVNIGVKKVLFRDYSVINTLSHKYDKLKLMRERADIVIIAHPSKTRGFKFEDMNYLSNYQYIELDWPLKDDRQPYLDAALSAGHPVFIAATDDCHNVYNPSKFGRAATFINSPSTNYKDIRDALLAGRSFATIMPDFEDPDYKRYRHLNVPRLVSLDILSDTLYCSFSEPGHIKAYGQNGALLGYAQNDSVIAVLFKKNDTYIRFTSEFRDGVRLYTNPVYRHTGYTISGTDLATISYPMTFVQTLILSTLVVFLLRIFLIVFMTILPDWIAEWSHRNRIFIFPRGVKAAVIW